MKKETNIQKKNKSTALNFSVASLQVDDEINITSTEINKIKYSTLSFFKIPITQYIYIWRLTKNTCRK